MANLYSLHFDLVLFLEKPLFLWFVLWFLMLVVIALVIALVISMLVLVSLVLVIELLSLSLIPLLIVAAPPPSEGASSA